MRSRILWGCAAVGALAVAGLAAAHADNVLTFGPSRPVEPAVYRSDNTPEQDRLLAKAAFTEVLSHKAEVMGMKPPLNLQPYAPIFPDGLITYASQSPASPTGGTVEYAAPGSLRTLVHFYQDAAALHRLPFKVEEQGPDIVVITAGDGRRALKARLTREFAKSTQVQMTYG